MIKSNIIINPDIQIYIYDRTLNIDPAEPSVIVTPGIKLSRPYMKICDGVPKEIDVRFRVIGFSLSYENDDDIDITKEALRLIDEAVSSAHLTLIKYLEHGCAYISAYKETDQDFIYNGEVD